MDDLKKAIELDINCKELAKKEKDFLEIKDMPQFQNLVT